MSDFIGDWHALLVLMIAGFLPNGPILHTVLGTLSFLGGVAGTMIGLHALIGIGEGVITALTVTAVAAARPDLVHLLRGTAKPLEVRSAA